MPAAAWIRKLTLAAVILTFGVVVLGAYVRLTAAGLGCPDWPLCYGHVTPIGAEQSVATGVTLPDGPFSAAKAWHEMIHRYAATTLGFLVLLIAALAIAARHESAARARYAAVLLALIVGQGLLGMLTVTWQLKPSIVTLHLLGGMTILGMLWWLWLWRHEADRDRHLGIPSSVRTRARATLWARRLAIIGLVVLACQITLGGWTSANYAATACPDFPTCQGSWWPHMNFQQAFVFWHPIGVDYQGGILSNSARVAIHFTHRLGALATTCVLIAATLTALWQRERPFARLAAFAVIIALAAQLAIGISMVLRGFPLWLATAHTAGAALLLVAVLALVHSLRPRPLPS